MIQMDYLLLITATLLAFLFSTAYYFILRKKVAKIHAAYVYGGSASGKAMSPNKLLADLIRTFVTGLVIAYAILMLNIIFLSQALLLGFWLWLGFPVVLLTGSVAHDRLPGALAAIHAGDWLVKILIIVTVLTVWR